VKTGIFFGELRTVHAGSEPRLFGPRRVWYRVLQPINNKFAYMDGAGGLHIPPSGMKTDFGSVPWPAQSFFPPLEYDRIYVIHDQLCYFGTLPRRRADWILLEGIYTIQLEGREKFKPWVVMVWIAPRDLVKRRTIYYFVRCWGIIVWLKKRRRAVRELEAKTLR